MLKTPSIIVVSVLFCLLPVLAFAQDESRVHAIRIEGNNRIATETYLYYISTKPGSVYDESIALGDFRRLWQTGFLSDLKIETETTPEGIDVIFRVQERALVKVVEYSGNKKVSTEDIETKLKDESILVRSDQPFDPYTAQRVVNAINELMTEKGLQFGKASYKVEPLDNSLAKLVFVVDEGPNVKIGKIEFEGNKVYDDGKLRGRMKDTKQHWMFSWISKHDDFEKEKFDKDMERVQELYFNNGYINVRIDEPVIELMGDKKQMKLTIPIQEGSQYKTGEVTFSGNKVFDSKKLQPIIPLEKGKVFNRKLLTEGMEEIQGLYGDQGHIYASLGPVFNVNDDKETVNLVIEVQENTQIFVNRIEFTGNDYTRDKVVRRELELQEGELLRVNKFRESIDHIYRLGFFDDIKPNIKPVPDKENLADISIELQENKRNEIRLGGGYSQLEGFFGDVVFSTKNLFGSGKVFTVNVQSGSRTRNYGLSILEPYFLDREISLGLTFFRQRYEYINFLRDQIGGALTFGYTIVGDLKGAVSYGYSVIDIEQPTTTPDDDDDDLFPEEGIFQQDRIESRVVPQLIRNTINSPFDPSRGTRLLISNEIVGGPFGGDLSYYKPQGSWTMFHRGLTKKQVFAYNIEGGFATGYNSKILPYFERYFLGGEQSIRGYEVRIVSPLGTDPITRRAFLLGGNKYFLVNAEYIIPIVGPVKIAGFLDYGNAFAEGEGLDFTDMRGSTGLEFRFLAPFLSTPFRFIYAINFNRGDLLELPESVRPERSTFRFSVGTTF